MRFLNCLSSSHIAILNICSSPSTHKFDILLSFGWIIFCIFSYFLLYFGIFIQNFNHYSIFVILHVRLQNYISIPIFNTFCYCTYRFTAIFPITINTATRTILTPLYNFFIKKNVQGLPCFNLYSLYCFKYFIWTIQAQKLIHYACMCMTLFLTFSFIL